MLFMFSNTSAGTVSTIDRAKSVKYIVHLSKAAERLVQADRSEII